MRDRSELLTSLYRVLNSTDGKLLVRELKVLWDEGSLMGTTPEETAYRVGKRDAFHTLLRFQEDPSVKSKIDELDEMMTT